SLSPASGIQKSPAARQTDRLRTSSPAHRRTPLARYFRNARIHLSFAAQEHLLHPQFLQILQPPSKLKGSPHSGHTTFAFFSATALGCGTGFASPPSLTLPSFSSSCTSSYISRSAFPTAIGQQDPLLVSDSV